jgi:hypothetical protein
MREIPLVLFFVVWGCGQPRAPSQEDACRNDEGCAPSLVCCHASADTDTERGFCVKPAVCKTVAAPPQPPLPGAED